MRHSSAYLEARGGRRSNDQSGGIGAWRVGHARAVVVGARANVGVHGVDAGCLHLHQHLTTNINFIILFIIYRNIALERVH